MISAQPEEIAKFIRGCLDAHRDVEPVAHDESLFLSGRLDSLSVTRLVVFLEDRFGVSFADHPFDVTELDSIDQIAEFVERSAS